MNIQYQQDLKRYLADSIRPIDEAINEEKKKINCDKEKILKLKQNKLFIGLFSNVFGTAERFRSPW